VPQMNAVEIAHGDHGPAGDLGGRGGVSDNGKTIRHFRDSLGILGLGERGPDRAAVPPSKSSGADRAKTDAIRCRAVNGLFNGRC
jgi:hypothetical protein